MDQQFKGIIFDMDGTMVDNMMVHHRAWQRKLASMGLEMSLEEVMEKAHGINEEIMLRLFGDKYTDEERKRHSFEKEAEYRKIFLPELKLVDGLTAFLDKMTEANVPMAIGTAAPPENVNFVMDNLNIHKYFKGVFHARSVKKGKPDPEIFQLAARSMDLDPADCMVFEDSPTGIETAKNAGAKAIAITTTHKEEEFQYPHVLYCIENYEDERLASLSFG